MKPPGYTGHPMGMNAIAGVCIEETAIQEEYREALSAWSNARSRSPLYSEAPEVLETTKRLEELELKLRNHRAVHGC
jgi:hypothetical protein